MAQPLTSKASIALWGWTFVSALRAYTPAAALGVSIHMSFEISSFNKVGPFYTGMSIDQLEAIMGPASEQMGVYKLGSDFKQHLAKDEVNCLYPHATFYFVKNKLRECAFAKHHRNELTLSGNNLDWKGKFIPSLKKQYPEYKEELGFIIFEPIGLSLADFFEPEAEPVIRVHLDKEHYEQHPKC